MFNWVSQAQIQKYTNYRHFLDSIKYVCYEKDKHKADVNISQHFQVLKSKLKKKLASA